MSTDKEVPPNIAGLLSRGSGVTDVASATAAGVSARQLQRLEHRGVLLRLASGCYAASDNYEDSSAWERFELRSRAFVLSCKRPRFLVEWGAITVWDLPAIGDPPNLPTVLRPKAARNGGELGKHGRVRTGGSPEEQRFVVSRPHGPKYPVMSAAWAVADLARIAPVHHAMVVADAALRAGEQIGGMAEHFRGWEGADRMRWVLANADARSESPLETLGRFTCIQFQLPMPVSNAWIGDVNPERRVDGLWPWHWAAHEGDGALKYDNRADAAKIVSDEKEREYHIRRELDIDIVRYGWNLAYYDRAKLARRFQAMLNSNPPRAEPVRWWKDDPTRGPVLARPEDQPSPHPVTITLPAGWPVDLFRTES